MKIFEKTVEYQEKLRNYIPVAQGLLYIRIAQINQYISSLTVPLVT